ncbi:TnsD family Tn7-like transposition protein [Escherichia coli]|uniref:TnsD n=1 Tax=Proteus mirabilis TaxID=584 RepID=A0A4Y6GT38_PROMI|nr:MULTISPECIES: TnsD family Tn7-like transposition protein [Enterobacterales]EAO2488070.1 transcriptional antiterminator [Salmonella enterica]ECC3526931.1 transcriptional antiterminator [Salmonella enterica subsp. enterica]EAW9908291.1 transcriptional antiterminator [Salmonella enterica]EBI6728236.1 transcriptional antiterminator [Salmonella enterica]EEW2298812.1 transcriptional antiterminator [Escherichia coli]
MRNFPVPYSNELIYSTIARAGVYHGVVSPKQLLDEVYGNRKVIATLDLPSHLGVIARHLHQTGRYSVQQLIYEHTLFPLYAPFVGKERRDEAMRLMEYQAQGAVHLMLGVAASRVKSDNRFRYCPDCVVVQLNKDGQAFWQRDWYLPALPYCPKHGALVFFDRAVDDHRHQFWALSHTELFSDYSKDSLSQLTALAAYIAPLLDAPQAQELSPSLEQWTLFYQRLAQDLGLTKGKHIRHDLVIERVRHSFSDEALKKLHLTLEEHKETCWLKSIFRKHRKTFSYLQHSIVWQALLPKLTVIEALQQVSAITEHSIATRHVSKSVQPNSEDLSIKRKKWQQLVPLYQGIKAARQSLEGGALYAWLYRHDRGWLVHWNQQHKQERLAPAPRVDWNQRDRIAVRQLLRIIKRLDSSLEHPRATANWLLKQIANGTSLAKNLQKLPLVAFCLQRYSESVEDYQIRRISQASIKFKQEGVELRRWRLLRSATLSKERITKEAQVFLEMVCEED